MSRTGASILLLLSLSAQPTFAQKPVKVTELTSFLTGAILSPDSAYIVKGSNVNMCATMHGLLTDATRPADVQYDRCSPSLLAFAQRPEAVEFVREHGGEIEIESNEGKGVRVTIHLPFGDKRIRLLQDQEDS